MTEKEAIVPGNHKTYNNPTAVQRYIGRRTKYISKRRKGYFGECSSKYSNETNLSTPAIKNRDAQ